jgi:hypothetical protein
MALHSVYSNRHNITWIVDKYLAVVIITNPSPRTKGFADHVR